MDIKGDILDKILLLEASTSKEPSSSSVNQTFFEHSFRDENDIHLPKVKLPEFDGTYENWSMFHDLYTSMIHIKTNISNAQKLYFLKKCLSGDAEALIRSIKCTNVNYATAWKTLCDRYDNKRFLVDSYLKILCEQPDMQKESSSSIRKLLYTTKECLDSISNLGVSTDSWDLFVIFLISQKLDKSSRRNWENFLVHKNSSFKNKTNELPKLEDFFTFLEDSFRSLEAVETKISIHSKEKTTIPNKTQVCSRSLHTSKRNFKTPSCICCHETHYLYLCPQFKAFSSDKKIEFAKNNNLCLNCLVQGHTVSQCKIKYNCRICNKRHHTLMHIENNNSSSVQISNNGTSKTQSLVCTDSTAMTVPQILLATAKVKISTPSGDHFLRALVDQGSQSSFITERCVQRLKLKKYPFNCVVSGIGSSISNVCKSFVEFLLKSCTNSSFETLVKALVMSSISDYLQRYPVSSTLPKEFDNITLADPSFSEPGNIDILIGADIFHEIILDGVIRPQNGPLAQHTELGWILSGPINSKNSLSIENTSSFHTQVNAIDNSLRKFWELEEVSTSRISTPEETACDNYFQNTFSRSANGRYIVKLPFKSKVLNEDYPIFKNSLLNAQKRFTHLEQRVFPKNQTLKEEYSKFINEYISLSHMKLKCNLQDLPPTENGFILPHHGIWKESSSTTKLRVVFDGSSKPVNSTSLNEELLPGPSL
ncbi:uncharacterized protein LOC129950812 [Eupeodes corollae]|uniref:uncharacterized protein LOC129950812 n=1 Tax=Eupeodes corollae TaxID=290404 RepID=UPI0024935A22|nr:uncharacterized protein LOC129950812 [Eupeodes corollae]